MRTQRKKFCTAARAGSRGRGSRRERRAIRAALRDRHDEAPSLVIVIFVTFFDVQFFDVHVNPIPFPGKLACREIDPIAPYNRPRLDVDKRILEDLRIPVDSLGYLHRNQPEPERN